MLGNATPGWGDVNNEQREEEVLHCVHSGLPPQAMSPEEAMHIQQECMHRHVFAPALKELGTRLTVLENIRIKLEEADITEQSKLETARAKIARLDQIMADTRNAIALQSGQITEGRSASQFTGHVQNTQSAYDGRARKNVSLGMHPTGTVRVGDSGQMTHASQPLPIGDGLSANADQILNGSEAGDVVGGQVDEIGTAAVGEEGADPASKTAHVSNEQACQ